jgi:hypothetical protein
MATQTIPAPELAEGARGIPPITPSFPRSISLQQTHKSRYNKISTTCSHISNNTLNFPSSIVVPGLQKIHSSSVFGMGE